MPALDSESGAVMLGDLSHVEKIYIRTGYTDMRKQLNGLVDIIQYNFKLDPYSNTLFLFCGRRADRINVSTKWVCGFGISVSGRQDLSEDQLERGVAHSCPGVPHWGFQ